MLRRASAQLDLAVAEKPLPWFTPAGAAGTLVRTAERIDSSLVAEFFWHAVSFARPYSVDERTPPRTESPNSSLAEVLARYDRDVAETIFLAGDPGTMNAAFKLVTIDPQRAVDSIESLPALDDDGWPKDAFRLVVVRRLALPDARFWAAAFRDVMGWLPDQPI